MHREKTIAIILAAGTGNRFGSEIPKQYLKLGKTSILQNSLEAFSSHPSIDSVLPVIAKEHENLYNKTIISSPKIMHYVFGGRMRVNSSSNALLAIERDKFTHVLIHDAARPLVSKELISAVIAELGSYDAVDVILPILETVKIREEGKFTVPNRDDVYLTQTPQGFKYKLILDLHKNISTSVTDDISLCIQAGVDVSYVPGDKSNIKITTKDDLMYAEYMIKRRI